MIDTTTTTTKKPSTKGWPLRIFGGACAIGMIGIGVYVLATYDDDRPSSDTSAPATVATHWAAQSLAVSLLDAGDAETNRDLGWSDTACAATSRTAADGTGFYVCTYRQLGDPALYIRAVETTAQEWRGSGAVYPASAPADQMPAAQVEQFLADPQAWYLANEQAG